MSLTVMAFVLPPIPPTIVGLPFGHYGISYDISLRKTEDNLPNGWHSHRGSSSVAYIWLAMAATIEYSDYRRPNSNPVAVWMVMVQLCRIQPPGKLQSTLLSLKMHYIHHLNDMDVTNQLQLGRAFSTTLAGPTPQALVAQVPPGVLNPPPVIPGAGFVRPVHTRPSAMADDPNNYRS
ncbi:hypothetical protein M378DRAFT_180510 [Amanita muscaria Koide BX008]|uniref:Uncharacterized protein n=1 Tax=Amanita muscaria (strain Koide BX008) TaxID=946122 RepID=A0A0C2WFU6_AMAMK|nr:hypothetical protein M378DRAFT_180510 [Amanita muscaria Koide BX008]